MTINSPRAQQMAPPSGDETPNHPYPSFTIEHEQDRWRPRAAATVPTLPTPPAMDIGFDENTTLAQYYHLKAFYNKAFDGSMSDEKINEMAMNEATRLATAARV
jgi:hypothetical protein